MPVAATYRAFISYSHADTSWAKWLHTSLEGFRIDKDLAGRTTPMGPVPATLRPVFRDRDEFTAGHTLTEQTIAALDASAALIVLCSPAAARSHYVNEEVRLFKSRHPHRPVIPVILGGTAGSAGAPSLHPSPLRGGDGGGGPKHASRADHHPTPNPSPSRGGGSVERAAGDDACFPPALAFVVTADGAVTDEPTHLLAADVRDSGDGRELALAKVVAALIGVGVDDVRKRQVVAEKKRTIRYAAFATVVGVLVLAAGFLWVMKERDATQQLARDIEMRTHLEAQRKEIEEQRKQFASLAQRLSLIAPAQAGTGSEKAIGAAVDAAIVGASQGDVRLQRALDLLAAGNVKEAEPLFKAVAEEKAARVNQDKRDAAAAYRNLGAIAGLGDPKRAREAYAKALELDPDDREALYWQGYLAIWAEDAVRAESAFNRLLEVAKVANDERSEYRAHLRLGQSMLQRGGSIDEALSHEDKALRIAISYRAANPENHDWQRDLAEAYLRRGNVIEAQGNLPEALKSFRESLSIRDRLAKADPGNAGWQRDLSVSYIKLGDVFVAQGYLPEALTSFRDSLAIADRLAKADPGNSGSQRDLSVSYDRVGDVLVAQGNLPEALKSFRNSLAIRDRLAKADPGNSGWQRDLSVSYNKLGDVLVAQGNLPEALKSFRDSLAIADRLAKADPGNAGWQRDLSVSNYKIGQFFLKQGKPAEALPYLEADLAIAERLANLDPANAAWQQDVDTSRAMIARVRAALGGK